MSSKVKVKSAFASRKEAAKIFPFLANPSMLSSQFRVRGSDLLVGVTFGGSDKSPLEKAAEQTNGKKPAGGAEGGNDGGGDQGGCKGNCGNGLGGGGGNGTDNEGKGKKK
jgi:hypothetical protein